LGIFQRKVLSFRYALCSLLYAHLSSLIDTLPAPFYNFFMFEEKTETICALREQGFSPGSCAVSIEGKKALACQATQRRENSKVKRLICAIHLSRPENYLSIYQSGCNFSCRKCHSWYFSKKAEGEWYTPEEILQACKEYDKKVTLEEPRNKATAYRSPTLEEMVVAFEAVKATGLKNVRLGNTGIFAAREEEVQVLLPRVGRGAF